MVYIKKIEGGENHACKWLFTWKIVMPCTPISRNTAFGVAPSKSNEKWSSDELLCDSTYYTEKQTLSEGRVGHQCKKPNCFCNTVLLY
jgi:hypothetical protein